MSNLVGALVGAAIDRRDGDSGINGDSGIKGAILGAAAEGALRIALPIAITFGIGWLVQYGARKAWQGVSGADPVAPSGELRT